MGAALRICPGCTRPVGPDHDCTARRRHDLVRTTRMPPQAAATRAAAVVRAIDDCRQDVDDATRALDALRVATAALVAEGSALVRAPSAAGVLRLQRAEEGVLRATEALRGACGRGA
jgi:hypothetical protein